MVTWVETIATSIIPIENRHQNLNGVKAMVGNDDEEDEGTGIIDSALQPIGSSNRDESKKSERKRKRERQRRSDLANAFDELSVLVAQLDPDNAESDNELGVSTGNASASSAQQQQRKRGRRKPGESGPGSAVSDIPTDLDGTGMTRLDLIGRTTMILRRLKHENTDLRRRLEDVRKGRGFGHGPHSDMEVLVMVPTLTATDGYDTHGHAANRPYPSSSIPIHHQSQQQPQPSNYYRQPPPQPVSHHPQPPHPPVMMDPQQQQQHPYGSYYHPGSSYHPSQQHQHPQQRPSPYGGSSSSGGAGTWGHGGDTQQSNMGMGGYYSASYRNTGVDVDNVVGGGGSSDQQQSSMHTSGRNRSSASPSIPSSSDRDTNRRDN